MVKRSKSRIRELIRLLSGPFANTGVRQRAADRVMRELMADGWAPDEIMAAIDAYLAEDLASLHALERKYARSMWGWGAVIAALLGVLAWIWWRALG